MGLNRTLRHTRRLAGSAARDARVRLPGAIRHLHGPVTPLRDADACVVVTLMRDALPWVQTFVEHHLHLGAARVVLVDNGSADGTLDAVPRRPEVTLLATTLRFDQYKQAVLRHVVARHAGPGWALSVDVDEYFDYPGRADRPLPALLASLRARGCTAMEAVMLDLYAAGPHTTWPAGGRDLLERCIYYDPPRTIAPPPLLARNRVHVPPELHRLWVGGVRERVFGVAPWLTKYPLLRPAGGALPAPDSPHYCAGGRVAEMTGVLRHYKFHAGFARQCEQAVAREFHAVGAREYAAYLAGLRANVSLDLYGPASLTDPGTDGLAQRGLLRAG